MTATLAPSTLAQLVDRLDDAVRTGLDVPRAVRPPLGGDTLRVAVVRLGRISNFTDLDPLSHEPGVAVRFTRSPEEVLEADLAVLPGTKATVDDLAALDGAGIAVARPS